MQYQDNEELLNAFSIFIQREIRCEGNGNGFLGFMENLGDTILTQYFTEYINNRKYYNWVNGNKDLQNKMQEWNNRYKETGKNIPRKEIINYFR